MSEDWKKITNDELLNFNGASTGQMAQYDRIMQHQNNVALSDLRKGMVDVKRSIHSLSENIENRSKSLEDLLNESSKTQGRLQLATVFLTIVIAISTVVYTWITWETVKIQRESNQIQLKAEQAKLKLKVQPNKSINKDTKS